MSEAPERIWMDPDIKFPECEKQYGCDVEYVRIDLVEAAEQQGYASAMEAERKLHEARIEELEKTCDEWAEVSQSNYQRARAAEAKLKKLRGFLDELWDSQSYDARELHDLLKKLKGQNDE